MSRRTLGLSDDLYHYLLGISVREGALLAQLREDTARQPQAEMQIAPEQGQFMALLVRLIGARRTIEIGVYTGYSSLWVALSLPKDGYILACDTSPEWTALACRYWQKAEVAQKIDLHLGPALETLDRCLKEGMEQNSYDFAFIDADKGNYRNYYEACLQLVRPGGLILIDNTLWGGAVADPNNIEKSALAIRKLNEALHQDERVDISLLPIGDGLTLLRRRI